MVKSYRGIGLMSGTSLDGMDIAYCEFEEEQNNWSYKLLNSTCINFPESLSERLKNSTMLNSIELLKLDVDFGRWIGLEVSGFIRNQNLNPQFIASHGYTVFHQPENRFTHQIGKGEEIHAHTSIPIINNFRQLDVSLGGQGAPLVPIGDKLLFREYDACLNLGGIANISFDENGQRVAFDICPVNMVLNFLAERNGLSFDRGGQMAKSGKFLQSLFERLENLPYYSLSHPKSLGYEWVRENVFSLKTLFEESPADLAQTVTRHIVSRINFDIMNGGFGKNENPKILVSGGGTHNTFLIEQLKKELNKHARIVVLDDRITDFKEAIIFAFLGLLRLKKTPNCLKSVTGAKMDNCGGSVIGGAIF